MRTIYFFINSALFSFYCFLFLPAWNFIPSSKIQESELYGQTLVVIKFFDPWFAYFGVLLLVIFTTFLILGICSRKSKNKFDKKIIFSKKGFFINIFLILSLFIFSLNSDSIKKNEKIKLQLTQHIYDSYKTKDTIFLPVPRNESNTSFPKRLNDSKGKDMNQLLDEQYQDECSSADFDSNIVGSKSPFIYNISFYNQWRFLLVNENEIDETIRLYKTSYKKDSDHCRSFEISELKKLQKKVRTPENPRTRKDADAICNIVNGTKTGC